MSKSCNCKGHPAPLKPSTPKAWNYWMQDKPCYWPTPPYYDVCSTHTKIVNGVAVKSLDCAPCIREKGIHPSTCQERIR